MSARLRRIVVVATYDERSTIVPLLERLLSLPLGVSVLVVDDSSPDGTAAAVRDRFVGDARVALMVRPRRLGYGSAMREGLLRALADGFETLVTIDADLSHDPDDVPALVAAAELVGGLAIGSRYANGVRVQRWEAWRVALSRTANAYVRRVLGLEPRDCTSGYRAYRASALRLAAIEQVGSRGYAFLVELLFRVVANGLAVVEVPIVYTERRTGQSKMSWGVVLESLVAPWRLRFRSRVRADERR